MTGGANDWDKFNARHVASHDVKPSEIEEAFHSEPMEVAYEEAEGEPR